MKRFWIIWLLLSFLPVVAVAVEDTAGEPPSYQADIEAIKYRTRGPFRRIRWFCQNGKVLAPKPYACNAFGGGVQHGEWTSEVRKIRDAGYLIANLLADYTDSAPASELNLDTLKQILVERFLVGYDDGWIFHKARFYRGAIQSERENEGALTAINWLLSELDISNQNYLLLWEAFRLLPRENNAVSATQLRDQATLVATRDPGFEKLRAKIHAQPEASDAQRVKDYSILHGKSGLKTEYLTLARQIEEIFSVTAAGTELKKLRSSRMSEDIQEFIKSLPSTPEYRFKQGSRILAQLREELPQKPRSQQLDALRIGALIEQIVFVAGNELAGQLSTTNRNTRLEWIKASSDSLYGVGMISRRGWKTISANLKKIKDQPTIEEYRNQLRDFNRVTSWANQWLKFHFEEVTRHFSVIEPLSELMIPTRLRGSPLQFYSRLLDGLLRDADKLAGTRNTIFGESTGSGLRALNPGIAKGFLRIAESAEDFSEEEIFLLPETLSTLPPVAGILTLGEGNSVSHIQLLAANLGIPNVAIDDSIRPVIEDAVDSEILLAVSAGGVVQIEKTTSTTPDTGQQDESTSIKPDLEKLDLDTKKILRLSEIRNIDSGRTAGPKAARLGELKHQFPDTVVEGLVIPFGHFRDFLDQPVSGSDQSLFDWMKDQYQLISLVEGKHKKAITRRFLRLLNEKIMETPFPENLRNELEESLTTVFGESGEYALFVRSDTNIEDLPGFNGAGLNLTVPNVVGFEPLLEAIKKVWSSPFTQRAFAWRQGRMSNPEHVYPSILLMLTVPVDKSGVMLTFDTTTGDLNKLTIATNFGIGGAVQGQAAEELRVDIQTGEVTQLADATNPIQKNASQLGGLTKNPVSADGQVLSSDEIDQLHKLALQINDRYPQKDENGETTIADVEFGFEKGQLRLFQIRPYLRSRAASNNQYLINLDQLKSDYAQTEVDLAGVPE